MDYKKVIIINLAFLIIIGKILQFIFNKMQRNLNRIDIDNNKILNIIFNKTHNLNLKEIEKDQLTYEKLQNFSKDLNYNLKKYEYLLDEYDLKENDKVFIINQLINRML